MKPSFESIGNTVVTPARGRPSLESIQRPVYDFGLIDRDERLQAFTAQTPNLDNNTRAKLVNSIYISDTYQVPFERAFQNHDGVINELFGRGTTAESALKRIRDRTKTNAERFNEYDDGYYDKARSEGKGVVQSGFVSFWEKTKDRYNRVGVNMVQSLVGTVEAVGDITFSETLKNWSVDMRNGVDLYLKEHPEEFLNPGGRGFWDTTWAYVSNPEYILLGALEQTPNIALSYLGGVAGKAVAGVAGVGAVGVARAKWIGGVQGFAVPSFGRRYSDLRGDGVSPIIALPEAFLGSQAEGLLEHWTLSKKIQIFKGMGQTAQRGMSTVVARTLLGGAKTYGRGAFEEGTQQISDNFLAIIFRDVDIGLLNDVGNQAAAGGILEMAMAGGFAVAGSFKGQVGKDEKLQRLETLREKINEIPLNQTHKAEINTEIDALKEQITAEVVTEPIGKIGKEGLIKEAKKHDTVESFIKSQEVKGNDADFRTDILRGNAEEKRLGISPDKDFIFKENSIPSNATKITVFRSAPGEIRPGDFVGLNKETAEQHIRNKDDKIQTKEVAISDLIQGADQFEAIFAPKESIVTTEQLAQIFEQAQPTEKVKPPVEVTEKVTEEVKPPKDLNEEIERTPRFGMLEGSDGKWQVIDYETQKEIGEPGGARFVVNQMNQYNSGALQVEVERVAPLPLSDKITLNVRQMLNAVMKGASKAAQTAYIQGAKDTIKATTNLSKFANDLLKGLDVTQGQRKTLLNAVSKPRTPAQQIAAMATIQRLADEAAHTEASKRLKKTISWINRHSGKSRMEGGIDPDYLAKIKDVTDTFLVKKISPKQRQRVMGLVKYLESIKAGEAGAYSEAYAESRIPQQLLAKIEQLEVSTLGDMTVRQIEDVQKILDLLIHLNKTKNRIINHRNGQRVAEALNTAIEETKQLKDKSTLTDKDEIDLSDRPDRATDLAGWVKSSAKNVFNFFAGNKNHEVETLTETISAGLHGSAYDILANGMSDGREVAAKFIDDWNKVWYKNPEVGNIEELQKLSPLFFQWIKNPVLRESIGRKVNLKQTPTYSTFKDRKGRTIKMTMAEMMSVYMMTENTNTVNEMLKAGVATPKMRLGSITFDEIVAIRKQVEGNKVALKMIEMAKDIKRFEAGKINETSRFLDGIDIANIEAYWHRERFTGGGVAGHQAYRNSLLESMGWLQERQDSGNPVVIRDFFEAMVADQQAISEYVGMASPYRNIKNLLNYKEYRDIIQTKGYGEELELLDSMVERTEQRPHEFSVLDNVVSKLMHGLTRSVLANPGIMAGQIASLVPIFENEMSSKYVSAINLKMDEAYINRLKEHWKIYKHRVESGISSIALQEIGQSDIALRTFTDKADFLNFLTKGIHYVDSVAVTAIGRVIESEMADGQMDGVSLEYWMNEGLNPAELKKDSAEYWDAFTKRANYVLRRTQPMFFNENRSIHTSDPSPTRKSLFLFRSYVDQPLRMAYRTMNNYRNGRISGATVAKQAASIWAGLAFYEIIRAAVRKGLFRSDEDEKDLLLTILAAPVKTLNIIGFPSQKMITEFADFKMTGDPVDLRFVDLAPLPLQFVNDVVANTAKITRGLAFSGTNKRFKTGKHKGELKSDVFLREGIQGVFTDTLRYYGIPTRQIQRLFREKDVKKKGFL